MDIAAAIAPHASTSFVLTNSRSLPAAVAARRNVDVARIALEWSRRSAVPLSIVSRSDSTLRGHLIPEVHALDAAQPALTGRRSDTVLLAPAFFEAGRVTVDDVHYVPARRRVSARQRARSGASTPRGPGHGLVVVGSHTDLTNAQVGRRRADSSIAEVVLDVPLVADVNARVAHLRRVSAETVEALAGADVLLVTSRARQQAGNGEANVQLARTVSAAITQRDADRSCGRPRLGRHEGRHHLPRCSGHRSRNSARDRARPGSSRDDLGAQPRRRAVGRAGQARRRVRRQCRRRNETR